jgi:hypothetical protein
LLEVEAAQVITLQAIMVKAVVVVDGMVAMVITAKVVVNIKVDTEVLMVLLGHMLLDQHCMEVDPRNKILGLAAGVEAGSAAAVEDIPVVIIMVVQEDQVIMHIKKIMGFKQTMVYINIYILQIQRLLQVHMIMCGNMLQTLKIL